MNSAARSDLHPGLDTLALYSRGDLPLAERWRIKRHVKRCTLCEHELLLFASAHAELKREASAQTLTGFEAIVDWLRLEREMLGNIGVGVAAARCIEKVGRTRVLVLRGLAIGGLLALFVAGWMTHIPLHETRQFAASLRRAAGLEQPPLSGTVLRATPDGITVRTQDATLKILHPASAVVSVSGSSAMAARYVDQETGQVTIANVYGQ